MIRGIFAYAACLMFVVGCGSSSSNNANNGDGNENDACVSDAGGVNTFTDCRDGLLYHTVEFAGSIWLAENLKYKPKTGNTWCYDNVESNCTTYGRLYDWEAAMVACPMGWHLADTTEWSMAIASGSTVESLVLQKSGRFFMNQYIYKDEMAFFWTSTPKDGEVSYSILWNNNVTIQGQYGRFPGFSVRCVKD